MTARLVLRLVARDWRAGELRLLLVAVVVAVGTVTAISLFVDRLHGALLSESSNFLAADRLISSSRKIPDSFREQASKIGLIHTDTMTFASMVFTDGAQNTSDERNQLVSVKAVGPKYPLKGTLRIADAPFAEDRATKEVPNRGEVWLDSRLFPALGLKLGDRVSVGFATFDITRVLTNEPDRGGSFFDLGPRLLMRVEDVPATRVVQPGSRIYYRLLLAGNGSDLAALKEAIEDQLAPNFRWQSIKESSPSIGAALNRAESFLLLGGLLAVLLAGVAVALGAHRYARRHYDHVAVLKTLGATPADIQWGYIGVLLVVGVVGVALGMLLGAGVHVGIIAVLRSYLPVFLPMPGLRPLVLGAVTGFICLFAFALPPLLALKNISPMRVIRRDLDTGSVSGVLTYGFAAAGSLVLLVWYSGSAWLTMWALVGTLGVSVVLAGLAFALLRGSRVLGMQARSLWRLALAGLQRRHRENVVQIMIFGLAIMLLLVLVLVRTALLDEWRAQLPDDTPNHFVMNVTPDELGAVQDLLDAHTEYDGRLFPLIRGRVVKVNGELVADWEARRGTAYRPGPRLRSERNLTWAKEVPPNNTVVEGEWWQPGSTAAYVSLESDYAADVGLQVGDTLEFDIGGLPLVAEVSNLRRVEWDSMQPNFFIMFSTSALEDFPATYMTSFYLESARKTFLNQLLSQHPTITVIEVDKIIGQIQNIISRVTQAVELVLALVLVSGALVLVASIQASLDTRMKEHALLRALGGSRKLIAGSLVSEFAVLGVFAGIVAVIGAEITVFALQTQVFELSYSIHPWLWLLGPLIGMVIIAGVGFLCTRKLINSPPVMVLREL